MKHYKVIEKCGECGVEKPVLERDGDFYESPDAIFGHSEYVSHLHRIEYRKKE